MPKRTDLAGGTINGNAQLVIQLIEPPDSPPVVAISWPSATTITAPASYPSAAAAVTRIVAESAIALAGLKAPRKL